MARKQVYASTGPFRQHLGQTNSVGTPSNAICSHVTRSNSFETKPSNYGVRQLQAFDQFCTLALMSPPQVDATMCWRNAGLRRANDVATGLAA